MQEKEGSQDKLTIYRVFCMICKSSSLSTLIPFKFTMNFENFIEWKCSYLSLELLFNVFHDVNRIHFSFLLFPRTLNDMIKEFIDVVLIFEQVKHKVIHTIYQL